MRSGILLRPWVPWVLFPAMLVLPSLVPNGLLHEEAWRDQALQQGLAVAICSTLLVVWGVARSSRYGGSDSFAEFEKRETSTARSMGVAFVAAILFVNGCSSVVSGLTGEPPAPDEDDAPAGKIGDM